MVLFIVYNCLHVRDPGNKAIREKNTQSSNEKEMKIFREEFKLLQSSN